MKTNQSQSAFFEGQNPVQPPVQPPLQPYATGLSQGRLYDEPAPSNRSEFARDRDRIIHSAAFRRLGHKTQVFIAPRGDHIRTRLTHSLEVAQIARALARALGADEDLTEAIALSHDLGHPPFGHSGEEALDAVMQEWGGYDHNDQSLRIVTELENRYPAFLGLNLTLETLEGIIKHNGPITAAPDRWPLGLARLMALPKAAGLNQRLQLYPALEAQIAGIADDIAYNHHDLDDGLRTGMITTAQIAEAAPHAKAALNAAKAQIEAAKQAGDSGDSASHNQPVARFQNQAAVERVMGASAIRALIGDVVEDVLRETQTRLTGLAQKLGKSQDQLCPDDIYQAGQMMVAFSDKVASQQQSLKRFLYDQVYRSGQNVPDRNRGQDILTRLFHHYWQSPASLPDEQQAHVTRADNDDRIKARIIADYIAGMTDRFATDTYTRLVDKGMI